MRLSELENSECVKRAKQKLCLNLPDVGVDYQKIKIGLITGNEFDCWQQLKDVSTGNPVGEVSHCRGKRGDPIEKYLAVKMADQSHFEAVSTRAEKLRTRLFHLGKHIGDLVEAPQEPKQSFWDRIFRTKRDFSVVFPPCCNFGEITVQYPISRKSKFSLRTNSNSEIPINSANSWFDSSSRLIISPKFKNTEAEEIEFHFLLSIVLRIHVFQLDFCD